METVTNVAKLTIILLSDVLATICAAKCVTVKTGVREIIGARF